MQTSMSHSVDISETEVVTIKFDLLVLPNITLFVQISSTDCGNVDLVFCVINPSLSSVMVKVNSEIFMSVDRS